MEFNEKMNLFLMYGGNALEALEFYASVFPDSEILSVTYNKEEDRGVTGSLLNGQFRLYDYNIMFMDMDKEYYAGFNTSTSLLITCQDEVEFYDLFNKLKAGGNIIMGPEAVGNLKLCTWVLDKFGFCWQLLIKE